MANNKKKNNSGSSKRATGNNSSSRIVSIPNAMGSRTAFGNRNLTVTRDGLRVKFVDRLDNLNSDAGGTTKGFLALGGAFTYFPWLKNIALNYSRYRVHGIRMVIASGCSTTTPGTITLAYLPEYTDVMNWYVAAEITSIFQMTKSTTAPVWSGTGLNRSNPLSVSLNASEIHQMSPWLYTGSGVAGDQNTRFAGAFTIQVSPTGDGGVKGQVFLEYDIEFVQPTSPTFNAASLLDRDGPTPPLEGGWHTIPSSPDPRPLPPSPKPES